MASSMEENNIQEAIKASIKTQAAMSAPFSYEPLNAEQRLREEGTPVGLKNVGNTCYLNSILQVYFNLPEFV